jgi:hypothetical protein
MLIWQADSSYHQATASFSVFGYTYTNDSTIATYNGEFQKLELKYK